MAFETTARPVGLGWNREVKLAGDTDDDVEKGLIHKRALCATVKCLDFKYDGKQGES